MNRLTVLPILLSISFSLFASERSKEESSFHFLNRLTFGTHKVEVTQLHSKYPQNASEKWLEDQMSPKPEKQLWSRIDKVFQQKLSPDPKTDMVEKMQIRKLMLANESHYQLREMLLDFWFNNFSVDTRVRKLWFNITSYDDAIRDNVFGSFHDLLKASMSHPAMVLYLDVATSEAKGQNENYPRELMEIETLGSGYTQKDIESLTKILTGWTVTGDNETRKFEYIDEKNEKSQKVWMGVKFEGKGRDDILKVIDILAHHEITSKHLCRKLILHFVNENGQPDLEKQCAAEYMKTKGDLKSIYRVLFLSPQLLATKEKIKKPFHFIASSVRSAGLNPSQQEYHQLVKEFTLLKEEPYLSLSPKGFSDEAVTWSGAFQLIFRQGAIDRNLPLFQKSKLSKMAEKNKLSAEETANYIGIKLSPESQSAIKIARDSRGNSFSSAELIKLIYSSPEFQRR